MSMDMVPLHPLIRLHVLAIKQGWRLDLDHATSWPHEIGLLVVFLTLPMRKVSLLTKPISTGSWDV